ncbi:MAG: homocysteine S-methyltransferase family protein [Fidelibacterota bacterium]
MPVGSLSEKILLLDGAMGTELQRRGLKLPLPLWSAEANLTDPEIVLAIHRDYCQAGADIITTNTFRTTTWTYRKAGYSPRRAQERARESLLSAVDLARKASGVDKLVAGSLTTLEDCYQPERFPGPQAAMDTYGETIEWFKSAGVDLLLFETMGHPVEIMVALDVSRETGLERWLSLTLKDDRHLLEESELKSTVQLAKSEGVGSLLLNCNTVELTKATVPQLLEIWSESWGVYPNLGVEQPEADGTIHEVVSDEQFITFSRQMQAMGTRVLGACCGSTPRHIALIREKLGL